MRPSPPNYNILSPPKDLFPFLSSPDTSALLGCALGASYGVCCLGVFTCFNVLKIIPKFVAWIGSKRMSNKKNLGGSLKNAKLLWTWWQKYPKHYILQSQDRRDGSVCSPEDSSTQLDGSQPPATSTRASSTSSSVGTDPHTDTKLKIIKNKSLNVYIYVNLR